MSIQRAYTVIKAYCLSKQIVFLPYSKAHNYLYNGEVRNADRIWARTPQNLASEDGVLCFLKCPRIFGLYYKWILGEVHDDTPPYSITDKTYLLPDCGSIAG